MTVIAGPGLPLFPAPICKICNEHEKFPLSRVIELYLADSSPTARCSPGLPFTSAKLPWYAQIPLNVNTPWTPVSPGRKTTITIRVSVQVKNPDYREPGSGKRVHFWTSRSGFFAIHRR